jgi:hypothetical protein
MSNDKLDDQMRPYWERLKKRLDLKDEPDIGRLFADRAVYDFTNAAGFRLDDKERARVIAAVCSEDAKSVNDLLNCIVRHVGSVKVAYPLTSYRYRQKIEKDKEGMFSSLAQRAQNFVSSGVKESDAIRRVLNNLSIEDQLNFLSWYGFKRGGEWKFLAKAKKENKMIKVAYEDDGSFVYEFMRHKPAEEQAAKDNRAPDMMSAEEFKRMRDKMIGRTFAIDKLLEKHRHLINDEQLDSIEDVLNTLRKNIRRLKLAGLRDSIEKTAFITEQNSWFEGAMVVRALMEDDDSFAKIAAHTSAELLGQVIDSLAETASHLRQRALIRDIAARDIDLFNLGYGHVSEVGDATAKLMEAFNAAANRIEDVVSRLRGELQQQTSPKEMPTKVRQIVKPEDLPLVKALGDSEEKAPPLSFPVKPS